MMTTAKLSYSQTLLLRDPQKYSGKTSNSTHSWETFKKKTERNQSYCELFGSEASKNLKFKTDENKRGLKMQ